MKYVIIGGVAGGATVAARLRRLDEKAEITLLERGQYVSYANCGLPYYIGGTIDEREKLFVQTKEGFEVRFRIDIRVNSEAIAIHLDTKTVDVKNNDTNDTYSLPYDKLVLSPGAEALRPPIAGINDERIFTLRNVPDTDVIKARVETLKSACQEIKRRPSAVIVGGGFIGLEMAENLYEAGLHVSVVEMSNQVMAPLDFSMAQIVHQHLVQKGVSLVMEDGVEKFEPKTDVVRVCLKSGKTIDADMVILSIGVRPETKLAVAAGLEIGKSRGIKVNDYMQTSNPDVYAVGDAVEILNPVTNRVALVPLAGPANKQARIAADNMVEGNKYKYKGTIGTSIAKVFDLTVAATGTNAKRLQIEKIDYTSSFTHPSSHAGYYPEALPMDLKIIFSPTNGRLLGAQIVGYDGVDKRIEMFAQVIKQGGTVYDLAEIEQAYAPPYSSAKDPVNMAGYVAMNILENKVRTIHWRSVDKAMASGAVGIDVRTVDEFALGSIPGFVNIPLDELREHLEEIPKDREVLLSCAVGLRGYLAYRILCQLGFSRISNLSGGIKTWQMATASIAKPVLIKNTAPKEEKNIKMIEVDACGLMCPGPILKLKNTYTEMAVGEMLCIKATDQAFGNDVSSWCRVVGAELVSNESKAGVIKAVVRKTATISTSSEEDVATCCSCSTSPAPKVVKEIPGASLIVFSDDLDKALASFVLANGAAAMGKKVTMFFTF
ncbi:MAG: FAD-dependent oxidoreductase, partial [Bacteroidaceae bacterium]